MKFLKDYYSICPKHLMLEFDSFAVWNFNLASSFTNWQFIMKAYTVHFALFILIRRSMVASKISQK